MFVVFVRQKVHSEGQMLSYNVMVYGLGFRVQGSGFGVWGLEFMVQGSRCRCRLVAVRSSEELRVGGSKFRVHGSRL